MSKNGKLLNNNGSGLLKLVCDGDSGRILGCHVVGSHAADLVAEAAVVIATGMIQSYHVCLKTANFLTINNHTAHSYGLNESKAPIKVPYPRFNYFYL